MKTKKVQKGLCGIVALTACCMLTGCHMSHEWQEATCVTPKTCSVGGETEGDALGHAWVEATCLEPKHCSVCGETEGDALGHTWVEATCSEPKHCSVCEATEGTALEHRLTEANYQQAATCEVCGETVGEPVQADFEKYGLLPSAELDTEYAYVTVCADLVRATIGKVTFSDYDVFSSDDTHEALEGYEWKAVTVTFVFDDDNAFDYGCAQDMSDANYYDIVGFEESGDESSSIFRVNYNGVDYSECKHEAEELYNSGWIDKTLTNQYRYFVRVPESYDGMVLAVYNYANKDNGSYINEIADDDTIFFRLN